jgi:hypothetical protein
LPVRRAIHRNEDVYGAITTAELLHGMGLRSGDSLPCKDYFMQKTLKTKLANELMFNIKPKIHSTFLFAEVNTKNCILLLLLIWWTTA